MRIFTMTTVAMLSLTLVPALCFAQDGPPREGDRPRIERGLREGDLPRVRREGPPREGERGPRDRGPEERGPRRPGGNPFMMALDTNRDGQLSAEEIKAAESSLLKLDKNGDGKLTMEELRPEFGDRRPGSPEGPGRAPMFSAEAMIARVMQFDKNKDGKLSKEEAPERMQQNFDRVDTNQDGFASKEEIMTVMKRFAEAGRRPGGPGARPRPDGAQKDGEGGGVRPKRPSRPEIE